MLTIGITTHNRFAILKRMAKSLYDSELSLPYCIRVYDDASTEFTMDDLRRIFPNAITIIRNEKSVGADKNSYLMYDDFLKTNDDYLFNADSDLIFKSDWLEKGMKLLSKSDGVLSLFNARITKPLNAYNSFVEKEKTGAAGILMTRKCVNQIVNNFKYQDLIGKVPLFDYKWCTYLRSRGIRILSVKESLVQHIGINGQNSDFRNFDYGIGFKVDSLSQGQIFNDLLMDISIKQGKIPTNNKLFPFAKVPIGSRVIIYGYGQVGLNYVNQIKISNYCKLVGVVDKGWEEKKVKEVKSPKNLKKWDFDYVVIAVSSDILANEIKLELLEIDETLENKIIF